MDVSRERFGEIVGVNRSVHRLVVSTISSSAAAILVKAA